MGAYGSPQLENQSKKQYRSPYQQTYQQQPYRVGKRYYLKIFLITVAVALIVFIVFSLGVGCGMSIAEKKYGITSSSPSSYSTQK